MGYFRELHSPKWLARLLNWYKPWSNPTCDIPERTNLADRGTVTDSVPVNWPVEYHGGRLDLGVGQKPYMGSVSGKPAQHVDRMRLRPFKVQNKWAGTLVRNGVVVGAIRSGDVWEVMIPEPVRLREDRWALEGYPNVDSGGDRHWYGVEDDGTTHEVMWIITEEHWRESAYSAFMPPAGDRNTCTDYCRFAPDGTLLDGVIRRTGRSGVVKGELSFMSIAWNPGDPIHMLGMGMNELAAEGHNGAASDGQRDDWIHPAYGRHYRLSPEVYNRLSANANPEQKVFLDSLFHKGIVPYDRGGSTRADGVLEAGVGMIAGAQHVASTIDQLNIAVTDLELVTGVA